MNSTEFRDLLSNRTIAAGLSIDEHLMISSEPISHCSLIGTRASISLDSRWIGRPLTLSTAS